MVVKVGSAIADSLELCRQIDFENAKLPVNQEHSMTSFMLSASATNVLQPELSK
jgi:hypothetical protein